ncbi:MAG: flagellar hook-basal body complex protein [Verrucomicrobiota bacterium]|nr:flagellar hook-basal body complex protein [Limisphaera sp.]MDW8381037.1 flagellar hook-basal body complex protein [Verrucomicrobiota bacterium]
MLRSLNSGIIALQQFQERMDVIGNNIANVNTTGFKSARVDFADTFSQTLGNQGNSLMQIGTGVTTSAIRNRFTQGAIAQTGSLTDLAISGQGFFVVRNSATGAEYLTRDGAFQLDANGYLITAGGLRLQGYADAALSTIGDLRIDNTGAPGNSTAAVASFTIDSNGLIRVRLADGTEFIRGQVLLQNVQNPHALAKEGQNLYSNIAAAGPLARPQPPGTSGVGTVVSGALELSNVDLAQEFSTLITTQRAFQAGARVVTTSDEILAEVVNLKR